MTSEVLQILMSPDNPYFRLSTFGHAGSTHVSFCSSVELLIRILFSGRSRPSDKVVGGGHPDPEIRGGGRSPKNFFSALRASFWSKNKRGAGGGRDPPLLVPANTS